MKAVDSILFADSEAYCSEEYFQRMLILERKKSKRSGRPFMLILLDIGKLLNAKREEKEAVFHRVLSALDSSTREIAIKGWYIRDSIIGIIYRDVYRKDYDSVIGKLSSGLLKPRYFPLNAKNADSIRLLRLFYPDVPQKRNSNLKTKRSHHGIGSRT
jgi:hypothetical protein